MVLISTVSARQLFWPAWPFAWISYCQASCSGRYPLHSGPSLAVSVLPMADRHKAPGALFQPISGHIPRAATVGHWAHLYPGLIGMHVHIERRGSSVQISSNSWRHMPFTSRGHSDRSLMKPPATRGTFLTCQHAIHACMQTVPVLEHRS
jgi:hypothetical protein